MIRSAASQDIVAFLGILEPRNWPECLHHLFMALDSDDLEKQEVSFSQFPIKILPLATLYVVLLLLVSNQRRDDTD